jgi:Fe-S cluster biogenesis protein NfuA
MVEIIEDVLDKYVRPKLAEHYGNVKVLAFNYGVLELKLTGQCSNCPSSRFTAEDLIEKELKEHIPEVKAVVLINSVSDDLLSFAQKLLKHEMKV